MLRLTFDLNLDVENHPMVMLEECHVRFDARTGARIVEAIFDPDSVLRGGDAVFERRQIVLGVGVLDVGQEL